MKHQYRVVMCRYNTRTMQVDRAEVFRETKAKADASASIAQANGWRAEVFHPFELELAV